MPKFLTFLLIIFINTVFCKDYFIHLTDKGLENKAFLISKDLTRKHPAFQKSNLLNYNYRAESFNYNASQSIDLDKWIYVSANDADNKFIDELQRLDLLDYFESPGRFRIHFFSNDSLSKDQWYLDKIDVNDAWKITKGDESVIVAIIDTGIDFEHPDLKDAIWINGKEDLNKNGILDDDDLNHIDDDGNGYIDDVVGWDFTDAPRFADDGDFSTPDNQPWDEFGSGHGTQCAGLIAAQDNNAIGIAGIAPRVKVMNIRAGTATGYLEEDDVARAILYAVENGASIISMSFGDVALSRFLKDVISYAFQKGVILVASAGNNASTEANYPASLPQVLSVGASTINDGIAGFSNYGSLIDLVAPGTDILSTAVGGKYNTVQGTSFSAPIVAAVAALVLSNDRNLAPQGVYNLLKSSAQDIINEGWDEYSGSGRISAARGLNVPVTGILNISNPVFNGSTAEDEITIIGSAAHPDILSTQVSYGVGFLPESYIELARFNNYQIMDDTLASFFPQIEDTVYTVKITLNLLNNKTSEIHHSFRFDTTEPLIGDVMVTPLLDGALSSAIISFKTDDICTVELHIRNIGEATFSTITSPYETKEHRIKIDNSQFDGDLEFYLTARNLSGLERMENNEGNYYSLSINQQYQWQEFILLPWEIPAGHMLDIVTDFDNDGNDEIVISRYDENSGYGPIEIYEFNNGQFDLQAKTDFTAIPRYAGDVDQDGKGDLLLGFGDHSFILEAAAANGFPSEITWEYDSGFWASIYTDLDKDNNYEITGRIDKEWVVLENTLDNSFNEMVRMTNPTNGENILGSPKSIWLDIEKDGFNEFIFGDYDGDLIAYSFPGPDQAAFFTTGKTINPNATEIITTNGSVFYTATHTSDNFNYEHQFDARYWTIEQFGLQSLSLISQFRIYTYGFADTRDYDSGLKISAFDDRKLMFASFFPDLFVFQEDINGWKPVWFKKNARSNTILVNDFDKDGNDEFYFNDGVRITGYTKGLGERPLAPYGIRISPADSTHINIKWQSVNGATNYNVYRGLSTNNLSFYATSDLTYYTDTIETNLRYYYALTSVDSTLPIPESYLGPVDSIQTSAAPNATAIDFISDRQLILNFDKAISLNSEKLPSARKKLTGEYASSILAGYLKKSLLISFSNPFISGQSDTLVLDNIFGETGVPLNDLSRRVNFNFIAELQPPYVQNTVWRGKEELEITFSTAMNMDEMENRIFNVEPSGNTETITVENDKTIIVTFSKDTYLGASGKPSYLVLEGVVSLENVAIIENSKIRLSFETSDIKNVFVYPQPAKPGNNEIVFANIPGTVDIRIFNINGRPVRHIKSSSSYGGVIWDLKDENGQQVNSGIYIYSIKWEKKSKQGKIAVIR